MKRTVPPATANLRDWRLFQELAARADALVTSGQYVRDLPHGVTARSFPVSSKPEYADLLQWRRRRGLRPQPAVVIVTASLDLPPLDALAESGRSVYVATGDAADPRKITRVESQGVRVLRRRRRHARSGRQTDRSVGAGSALEHRDAWRRRSATCADRRRRSRSTLSDARMPDAGWTVVRHSADGARPRAGGAFQTQSAALRRGSANGSNIEQLFAILDRWRLKRGEPMRVVSSEDGHERI